MVLSCLVSVGYRLSKFLTIRTRRKRNYSQSRTCIEAVSDFCTCVLRSLDWPLSYFQGSEVVGSSLGAVGGRRLDIMLPSMRSSMFCMWSAFKEVAKIWKDLKNRNCSCHYLEVPNLSLEANKVPNGTQLGDSCRNGNTHDAGTLKI